MTLIATEDLKEFALYLAQELESDVRFSRTREDHIRMTRRANEAAALYNTLISKKGFIEDSGDNDSDT